MVALAAGVDVDGIFYPAGTDQSAMPTRAVDRIRNPLAWVGGVAPAVTAPLDRPMLPSELSTPAKARAALGLAPAGDGRSVPATTISANYTLAAADTGTVIESTGAGAVTVTVPPNSAVPLAAGTVIELTQYGTGQITVAAGAGVTVLSAASMTTRARYSTVALRKRGTNEWILSGDLT